MKTLDAKALKLKKDNLHAEFEKEKKRAVQYDELIAKATKSRDECLDKMSSLQGAYKVVEDLEKQIGVKPQLPANLGKKPAKK